MAKSKGKTGEDTQISDLDAFEEWEEGAEPEEATVPPEDEVVEEAAAEEAVAEEQGDEGEDEELDFADFEQMEAEPEPAEGADAEVQDFSGALAELAPDVPINLVAVIGKTATNVGEIMKLKLGQVVELGRPPGETVDVVANGRLIARGELVDIDGTLGVRILKMVK